MTALTPGRLQSIAGRKFDFIVTCTDGTVLFAVPIPGHPELSYRIEPDGKLCLDAPPFMAEDELEYLLDVWEEYASGLLEAAPKRQNRTRRRAGEAGAVVLMPDRLALSSCANYEGVLSPVANSTAYLQPIIPQMAARLHFENGTLYCEDIDVSKIEFVKFYDNRPQRVSQLDVPTLSALYTILLAETMKSVTDLDSIINLLRDPGFLDRSVTIYMPDFLRMMGHGGKAGRNVENAVMAKIASYEGIMGVMKEQKGGRTYCDYYPVMQLRANEQSENTIRFASPYLNKSIAKILNESIQRDKKGRPKLMRNGKPLFNPNHCYLVKSSIVKERNKKAVEIVFALAVLIDRAGGGTPNIKPETLIGRCPELKASLDAAATTRQKNIVLKRAFSKAWELMETQTIIKDEYDGIEFPGTIPTTGRLRKTITITHNGKKEGTDQAGAGTPSAKPKSPA